MAKKIKIVQIIGDGSLGGTSPQILLLSKELKKRGYDVLAITHPGAIVKKLESAGIEAQTITMGSFFDRKADHKIRLILSEAKPDIVHCHGVRAGWLGRLAARKLPKIGVVYSENVWTNDYHLRNPVWENFQLRGLRFMEKFTDITVAPSEAVKRFLTEQKICTADKTIIAPSILEPSVARHKRYPKPKEVPQIIGATGSLNSQKGYLSLLEALKLLEKQKLSVGWHCQIIGAGPLERPLRKKIKKLKLDKRVFLKTNVANILDAMRHFSYYVQNSSAEAIGQELIEAMALGIAPIVADKGVLPEIVSHRQTGLVAPFGKPEKLAEALAKLIKDENLTEKLGREARRAVLKKHGLEVVANQMTKVYEQAMKNRAVRLG